MMPLPTLRVLSGISVLDFTRNLAGPYCTMLLGDLGADVIKVESPERGDDTRHWRPPAWNDESATFLACNRNKRSLALNLDTAAGQDIARRLADKADVVVSSFRPGSLEKRGLDYASLRLSNPGLIFCSISAYGSSGPKRDFPGYDPVLQAESGLMELTGFADGSPARLGIGAIDLGTALWATIGIQAALTSRAATGTGSLVEVSLFETTAWWLSYHISGLLGSGVMPHRQGTEAPFLAPYETFDTADGQLMVTAGNDHLFAALCEALGIPELINVPAFRDNSTRVANRADLHARLEERFRKRPASEWYELLVQASVPCSPVRTIADFIEDEQFRSLGLLRPVAHPTIPDLQVVDAPITVDGVRPTVADPPPLLGADTADILDGLGLTGAEIGELERDGVVRCNVPGSPVDSLSTEQDHMSD